MTVQLQADHLPLHPWHLARGAKMVGFAGYQMPIQYDGILTEHLWTREQAGLFDISHMGQLMIKGPGLDAAIEQLLPIDAATLQPGQMRYSLLLSQDGGILDDLMVTRTPDGLMVVANGATKHTDIAHLRSHLPGTIQLDHLADQALLALQGPKAVDVLARFVPGVRALAFMNGAAFQLGGIPTWISRSGYTGEDGFEISLPASVAYQLATWLWCEPEVRPVGLGARDSLRLEAGLPLYGHDLDGGTSPASAGLGFAIPKRRREQGGFLGAASVLAEIASGPLLRRVGLIVEGRQPVREGAVVLDMMENEVGRVTSGGFSPTLQQPIAMAYVPAAMSAQGEEIVVAQRGKLHRAKVTPLPFVDHRYVRKKG